MMHKQTKGGNKMQLSVQKKPQNVLIEVQGVYQKAKVTTDLVLKQKAIFTLEESLNLLIAFGARGLAGQVGKLLCLLRADFIRKIKKQPGKRTDLQPASVADAGYSKQQIQRLRVFDGYSDNEIEEICNMEIAKDNIPSMETFKKREIDKRREAVKLRKLTKEQQAKLKDVNIYGMPIQEFKNWQESESIDVILTDPPYQQSDLNLFKELSHFAGKVLKPGGVLLCMSGKMFFPEVLKNLQDCPEIKYHWMLSYLMDGPTQRILQRNVVQSWKPVIMFVKEKYTGEFFRDRVEYKPPEKTNEYHKWGQALEGITELLNKFAFPGDVICDPFLGAGSTALAAYQRGCRFVGSDIDTRNFEIISGRFSEHFEKQDQVWHKIQKKMSEGKGFYDTDI